MGIADKPWFRKFLISLVGKPLLKKFNQAIRDVKNTQSNVLNSILETCKDTAFGKDHGFANIKTIDDYRAAVPIGSFEDHRSYVERMCNGASDILFPGRPLFYNTTSGTTAKAKHIPVSPEYYQTAYTGISRLWLYSCLLDNPNIYNGKSLSAVSTAEEGQVADGTPYGSISGMVYKNIPKVLQSTYCMPYSVICIKDYLKKYYAMLRCALENDITIIVSPSPSNLLRFHQTVVENFDDYVKHIHDGSIRQDILTELTPEDQEVLKKQFKPNPQRARVLEDLMKSHGDHLRPKHYWPNLAMVTTWKQGNFALLIPKLDGYFPPGTPIRAFGYQASEGRAGLVLGNDWDYSILAAHIYHFEFIEEQHRFQDNPPVLLAHEVEVGKRYYIFFTNGSGLYRYDINDIVEIIGFHQQVPLFKFIQKGEGVTSLTGEKLSEEQVIQAVGEVGEKTEVEIKFYVMFCDEKDLCYKFYVEFAEKVSDSKKNEFHAEFDKKLRILNPEYEVKRGSKRLSQPVKFELKENSYESLKEILVAEGITREGQYKDIYLTAKRSILPILEGLRK